MYTKILAAIVLLAVAFCQEHSQPYNLQNIVRHGATQQVSHIPIQTYQTAPIQQYYSGGHQSQGHALSSQSIIRHDDGHQIQSQGGSQQYIIPLHRQLTPVHEIVSINSAPAIQIQSGHQSLGHAVSSQSIVRHESGHNGHSQGAQYVVAAPIQQTYNLHSASLQSGGQSHGQAVSSQSIIRHDSGHQQSLGHQILPIQQHVTPIQAIGLNTGSSFSGSQSHGQAVSSQSIVRHNNYNSNGGSGNYVIPVQHHATPVHNVIQAAPVQHIVQQSIQGQHGGSHYDESGHEDYYAHPKYEFQYKVEDPHTGDNKYQQESRDGDVVRGVYSLHEADGSIRTVEYSADHHNGFNALVHNSGASRHIEQQSNYHH